MMHLHLYSVTSGLSIFTVDLFTLTLYAVWFQVEEETSQKTQVVLSRSCMRSVNLSSFHSSSVLSILKIQPQSFQPSPLFPAHSLNSGQTVRTCPIKHSQCLTSTYTYYPHSGTNKTVCWFFFNTWLAFPGNRTGSWGHSRNRSHRFSSKVHQCQTDGGQPEL